MSTPVDAFASSSSNHNNFLLSIFSKDTLDGTNYTDWMCNIKMSLQFKNKDYVLKKELNEIDEEKATPDIPHTSDPKETTRFYFNDKGN